jgi:hypothetical protein
MEGLVTTESTIRKSDGECMEATRSYLCRGEVHNGDGNEALYLYVLIMTPACDTHLDLFSLSKTRLRLKVTQSKSLSSPYSLLSSGWRCPAPAMGERRLKCSESNVFLLPLTDVGVLGDLLLLLRRGIIVSVSEE